MLALVLSHLAFQVGGGCTIAGGTYTSVRFAVSKLHKHKMERCHQHIAQIEEELWPTNMGYGIQLRGWELHDAKMVKGMMSARDRMKLPATQQWVNGKIENYHIN